MSRRQPKDLGLSIRNRLAALARERGENTQFLMERYATERLLYRLSLSPYAERFVLKGARLFQIWTGETHRPTRDVDFLGFGDPGVEELIRTFHEICTQPVPEDGIAFPTEQISGSPAREDQEYQGATLRIEAHLAGAVLPLQIDFGFGDAITPAAEEIELPVLLGFPAPRLRSYPRETVIAEKLQAMVFLGIANSRMKDFYDLWYLSQRFDFDGRVLARAVRATFDRRATDLPQYLPLALTAEFSSDINKQQQWSAFVRRSRLTGEGTQLPQVIKQLELFLAPPMEAARESSDFPSTWDCQAGRWILVSNH